MSLFWCVTKRTKLASAYMTNATSDDYIDRYKGILFGDPNKIMIKKRKSHLGHGNRGLATEFQSLPSSLPQLYGGTRRDGTEIA